MAAAMLDPLQMMNAGTEPWTDSLGWIGAFLGIVIVAAVGLRLWHTRRFRPIAILLVLAQLGFVAWAISVISSDYF